MMKAGIYARVSTHDQQTLPMQIQAMRRYVKQRGWKLHLQVEEVGSGGKLRPKREELLKAARRREVDSIVVWKLDRWGRSLPDLISSLAELRDLGIAFVSLTEALDFTTSAGRAMVGLLSVFAEFERDMIRERVKAGIAQARADGKQHGRPQTAGKKVAEVKRLYKKGWNKSQIARELEISRGSVINMLK
jgi:DNA invertase Pin-like site-specific DNA recombinase